MLQPVPTESETALVAAILPINQVAEPALNNPTTESDQPGIKDAST